MVKESKSKYDIEVLKNEVFFFDDEKGFRVVDSQMVQKVSRTDRKYKVRRLWVTSDDENMLEISTQSFNKKSFRKRLDKITTKWIYKKEPVEVKEEPTKFEIELTSVMWRTKGKRTTEVERAINDMTNIDDINELKKYWRTECKKFHPDHGGNAEDFAEVRFWYEEELRNIESIQTALDEILNESVVKEEQPTKFELVVSEFQKDRNTFSDLRKSDDLDAFMGCETEEEVKETYKRLAKIYHPDCGGSQIQFEVLKDRYEFSLRRVRRYVEVVGEIKEMQDLRTTYNLKDLKSAYRKLSMKHHPDHDGDVEQFKLVKTIYDVRKRAIEENAEVFGYDDPNFAFLVDLYEDLTKSMEGIQY